MMDYGEQYERGMRYQDFITDQLMRRGMALNCYSSKQYQLEKGESASGIEVKYDSRMHKTGNVYIETHEKSRPDLPEYTPSGVLREDGSWLLLIGNYNEALLMGKRQVGMVLCKSAEYMERNGIKRRETPTSIGYTLPVTFCDEFLALRHYRFV